MVYRSSQEWPSIIVVSTVIARLARLLLQDQDQDQDWERKTKTKTKTGSARPRPRPGVVAQDQDQDWLSLVLFLHLGNTRVNFAKAFLSAPLDFIRINLRVKFGVSRPGVLGCALILFNCHEKARLVRKIPGPDNLFLVGNALELLTTPMKTFGMLRKFASTRSIYRIWVLNLCSINIFTPDHVELCRFIGFYWRKCWRERAIVSNLMGAHLDVEGRDQESDRGSFSVMASTILLQIFDLLWIESSIYPSTTELDFQPPWRLSDRRSAPDSAKSVAEVLLQQ
ncbi:hypothetical protein evm_014953 [Chilo suppressalis]|nr:hypothetical protein evm_014953 [Chilo suppressalis]